MDQWPAVEGRFVHQLLGPGFARFKLRTVGSGTKHRQSRGPQLISQPFGQRSLWPDHHKVNPFVAAVIQQPFMVGLRQGQAAIPRLAG